MNIARAMCRHLSAAVLVGLAALPFGVRAEDAAIDADAMRDYEILREADYDPQETRIVPNSAPNSSARVWWRKRFDRPVAYRGYSRFRVRGPNPADDTFSRIEWRLAFRDVAGSLVAELSAADFARSREVVTPPLFEDSVVVTLEAKAFPQIDGLVILGRLDQRDLVPIKAQSPVPMMLRYDHPKVSEVQRAQAETVAKLRMGTGVSCTAVLVAPGILATNAHCLRFSAEARLSPSPDDLQCGDISVLFDFRTDGGESKGQAVPCLRAQYSKTDQDVAYLTVDQNKIRIDGRNRRTATLGKGQFDGLTPAYAAGHPVGVAIRFSRECELTEHPQSLFLLHNCETYDGSSGSPIFSKDGLLIALHFKAALSVKLTFADIQKLIERGIDKYNGAVDISALREEISALSGPDNLGKPIP